MRLMFLLLAAACLFSCSHSPTEPEPNVGDQFQLEINRIAEDALELTWQTQSDENTLRLSKKTGEADWEINFAELTSAQTSFIDTVYTQAFLVYSYFLSEMATDSVIAVSDTVAWFSDFSLPQDFSLEQIRQDSIKLSWQDKAWGEFCFGLDKKIGNGIWQEAHILFEPPAVNGHNSLMSCLDYSPVANDTIYYRLYIKNGSSQSEYISADIYAFLLPPADFQISVEGSGFRLNWCDNYLNESGFVIERKQLGGEFSEICQTAPNTTSYLDDTVDPATIYCYRLKVMQNQVFSDYTQTVMGRVLHDGIWVPLDYFTIQEAVEVAADDEEIIILPGIYYENVLVTGKNLHVSSLFSVLGDQSYISQTIIDGNMDGSVFAFQDCIAGTSEISGLTLRNGSGNLVTDSGSEFTFHNGGGILCLNSNLLLSHLVIQDNQTELGGGLAILENSYCILENSLISNNRAFGSLNYNGGGIYCRYSELVIDNSTISQNNAMTDGGGILMASSTVEITNSIFEENFSGTIGGGICISVQCDVVLENLMIRDNTAIRGGGGIKVIMSSPVMRNLTIYGNHTTGGGGGMNFISSSQSVLENIILYDNTANQGAAIYASSMGVDPVNVTAYSNVASDGGGAFYSRHTAHSTITNCIFWNNLPQEVMIRPGNAPSNEGSVTISYSDIEGGEDNISALNADNVHWIRGSISDDPLFVNAAGNDFHLQQDSPCVDAGFPSHIYQDPDGSRNDMGAYGGPSGDW